MLLQKLAKEELQPEVNDTVLLKVFIFTVTFCLGHAIIHFLLFHRRIKVCFRRLKGSKLADLK